MVKYFIKKILTVVCIISLLITRLSIVMADEMQVDFSISDSLDEYLDEGNILEESIQETSPPDNHENTDVTVEERQSPLVLEEIIDEDSTDISEQVDDVETYVGAGDIQIGSVGENVSAVYSSGSLILYSNNGTLSTYWKNEVEASGVPIERIRNIYVESGIVFLPVDSSLIFSCKYLNEIDLSHFDTSKVENMSGMFRGCEYLSALDLSGFDTSSVVNMKQMFSGCKSLKELNLSSFDTSQVTDMSAMFGYSTYSYWKHNVNVVNESYIYVTETYWGCQSLTALDLSGFETSNVFDMHSMFHGCSSLAVIDMSNFDTTNVENASDMFYQCFGLECLNTPKVNHCNNIDLPLQMYNTSENVILLTLPTLDESVLLVRAIDIRECLVTLSQDTYYYDGTEKEPVVSIIDNYGNSLCSDIDYTLSYTNNINVGTGTVTITGKGKYIGKISKTFTIGEMSIENGTVTGISNKSYNGAPHTQNLTIKVGDKVLTNGIDYTLSYLNNTNVGTATVTIIGKGNYAGSIDRNFIIYGLSITDATVTEITDKIYNGTVQTQNPTIKYNGVTLTKDVDYILSYDNNINAGTATVTISGKGNYIGTNNKTFTIKKAASNLKFANASVGKTILDATFTNTLTKTTDGNVTFKSGNTGVATVNSTSGLVTIKGIGETTITATASEGTNYKSGKASYTLTVIDGRTDVSTCTVTISPMSYTYNGSARKSAVTVKNGNATLSLGTDYTVSYKNNTNAGTATVIVTGKGSYTGTVSKTFTINKAEAKLAFANASVSKTTLEEAFTNELTKTTDGLVTFSSSDTKVAEVDKTSGQVTIKGIGTTTITATTAEGMNYKEDSASYTLTVTAVSIETASVAGVSLSYGYSGKVYTPVLTVKVDGVTLTEEIDYTVKYENNINPGTATITLNGIGNYTGVRVKTFEIVDCVSSLVSGKTYQIIPKNNSSTAVCSFSGRMVNNTKVYITNRSSSEAMKFKAVKNTDGSWKFINAKCELALAVQQNSSEAGKGLVLYDQTTRPAQNWKLSKKADNSFAIINSVTGYSIAMSDKSAVKGTTLSMAESASVGLQRFYLVETSAVSAPFDGTKSIRAAKNKNFSVNIASASKADGANVNLYTYSNTNARKFKIIYSGGGYYRLVNVNSGLCLTIKGNSNADGANIIQSKWKGYSSQRWKIKKNSDGTVTITNMLGTVLHLVGNRTTNNTNVHARKATSTTAQKWYLN